MKPKLELQSHMGKVLRLTELLKSTWRLRRRDVLCFPHSEILAFSLKFETYRYDFLQ